MGRGVEVVLWVVELLKELLFGLQGLIDHLVPGIDTWPADMDRAVVRNGDGPARTRPSVRTRATRTGSTSRTRPAAGSRSIVLTRPDAGSRPTGTGKNKRLLLGRAPMAAKPKETVTGIRPDHSLRPGCGQKKGQTQR